MDSRGAARWSLKLPKIKKGRSCASTEARLLLAKFIGKQNKVGNFSFALLLPYFSARGQITSMAMSTSDLKFLHPQVWPMKSSQLREVSGSFGGF